MSKLPTIMIVPAPEPAEGIFPALLAGLREFRARVEGTDQSGGAIRDQVLELQSIRFEALAKRVGVAVLETLREIIAALHRAVTEIDGFLGPADAIVAMIEVFGRALLALGDTLEQPWPPPMAATQDVGQALGRIGDTLANAGDIQLPSVIPLPSTLAAIVIETRALLGTLVDPEADPAAGSLVALIADLETASSP